MKYKLDKKDLNKPPLYKGLYKTYKKPIQVLTTPAL